MVVESSFFNIS